MSKLEEIKNEYAKEKHFESVKALLYGATEYSILKGIDEIAKRYAKAKLEEANEEIIKHAKRSATNDGDQWDGGYLCAVIDSEIIINKILNNPSPKHP